MTIPQNDILMNPLIIYKNIEKIFKEYKQYIEENDNFKESFYKECLEKFRSNYFWFINSSEKICCHMYKNGKKEGQLCGAKVFIKTNNRLQKYLCSRHCRDYESKKRILKENEKYCDFVKENGNQCLHKCKNNEIHCYIHKKEDNKILVIDPFKLNVLNINKKLFIDKLKKRREIYFLKRKKKYINNNIIINFKDFSKISKISKISNLLCYNNYYKSYNYIKDIT